MLFSHELFFLLYIFFPVGYQRKFIRSPLSLVLRLYYCFESKVIHLILSDKVKAFSKDALKTL